MDKLNPDVILSNVSEAREELEQIEALIRGGEELTEGELWVMFGHAYHHLNFAWNARRVTDAQYRNLTDKDFNAWGGFPTDILLYTAGEDD
ncbi:MAG TPA: hypothetical protein VF588_22740 [Pyrinomonadaceae bacterium]|jgi:hypothetical protein